MDRTGVELGEVSSAISYVGLESPAQGFSNLLLLFSSRRHKKPHSAGWARIALFPKETSSLFGSSTGSGGEAGLS